MEVGFGGREFGAQWGSRRSAPGFADAMLRSLEASNFCRRASATTWVLGDRDGEEEAVARPRRSQELLPDRRRAPAVSAERPHQQPGPVNSYDQDLWPASSEGLFSVSLMPPSCPLPHVTSTPSRQRRPSISTSRLIVSYLSGTMGCELMRGWGCLKRGAPSLPTPRTSAQADGAQPRGPQGL